MLRYLLICSCGTFGYASSAIAALPAAVNGEPLPSLAPMVERVTPAVVNIATRGTVTVRTNPLLNDPFFRRFFDIPDQALRRPTQSLGSGVIVDAKRGLVLTNNHVIANADLIRVKLRDGRDFEAKLVGTDPDTDIAVIEIPADNLTEVPRADSEKLRVGDFVVAVGNPFGLGQTVTSGIISALARSGLGITGYEDFIQTDASINPGNSGGALVNLRGELVGINNAILSESGGNIGIGFAIPINMAYQIMSQLVAYGEVRRGFVGASLQDLTPELAEAFGIRPEQGVLLVEVLPGSPAERAGLKAGDIVTAVNSRAVHGVSDFKTQVGLVRVGDDVRLDVIRDGKRQSVVAQVADRLTTSANGAGDDGKLRNSRLRGATFGDLPENQASRQRTGGVYVYEVDQGSGVWNAGIRAGDIILSVNRQPIATLKDFLVLVNQAQGQLLLQVRRGNEVAFVLIR
ncbi:MAG: DegQ family serine endoprotease [Gammaproteobacteria bacterium]|nr:DegQ family serine endoprotease [Gammaproteobacteria bacterium]